MNKLLSCNDIAVGSPGSIARYECSKVICCDCICVSGNKDTHTNKQVMSLGNGTCDCCENKKDTVYMVY